MKSEYLQSNYHPPPSWPLDNRTVSMYNKLELYSVQPSTNEANKYVVCNCVSFCFLKFTYVYFLNCYFSFPTCFKINTYWFINSIEKSKIIHLFV